QVATRPPTTTKRTRATMTRMRARSTHQKTRTRMGLAVVVQATPTTQRAWLMLMTRSPRRRLAPATPTQTRSVRRTTSGPGHACACVKSYSTTTRLPSSKRATDDY
ncbi:hypothetical protein BN1723_020175, partial [Verticillium longisporum]